MTKWQEINSLSLYKSFGLPVSIIRPFNTYGPRQSTRAIIPTIITQCLRGSIIKVGSIFPTRDFVYVSDTVEGFTKTIGNHRAIGEIINLGTGYEISVKDLIKIISKKFNHKSKIKVVTQDIRTRPKK